MKEGKGRSQIAPRVISKQEEAPLQPLLGLKVKAKEALPLAANVTQTNSRLMHFGHKGERCKMRLIFLARCITGHLATRRAPVPPRLLPDGVPGRRWSSCQGLTQHSTPFPETLSFTAFRESQVSDLQLASLPERVAQPAAKPAAQPFFEAAAIVSLAELHLLRVLRRKTES